MSRVRAARRSAHRTAVPAVDFGCLDDLAHGGELDVGATLEEFPSPMSSTDREWSQM